jgi:hypothetical protein
MLPDPATEPCRPPRIRLIAVKARPIDRWIREQEERQSLESAVVRIVLHGRPEVPREATAKERRELSAWSEQRKVPKRSGGDSTA